MVKGWWWGGGVREAHVIILTHDHREIKKSRV